MKGRAAGSLKEKHPALPTDRWLLKRDTVALAAPMTRPLALAGTLAFFTAQAVYSRWWFDRYRIGALEWAWRSLTYWRPQAFRIQPRL